MPSSRSIPSPCDCLGRTCLEWSADGELNARDRHLVIQRLALVDPEVTVLEVNNPDVQFCSSHS